MPVSKLNSIGAPKGEIEPISTIGDMVLKNLSTALRLKNGLNAIYDDRARRHLVAANRPIGRVGIIKVIIVASLAIVLPSERRFDMETALSPSAAACVFHKRPIIVVIFFVVEIVKRIVVIERIKTISQGGVTIHRYVLPPCSDWVTNTTRCQYKREQKERKRHKSHLRQFHNFAP